MIGGVVGDGLASTSESGGESARGPRVDGRLANLALLVTAHTPGWSGSLGVGRGLAMVECRLCEESAPWAVQIGRKIKSL